MNSILKILELKVVRMKMFWSLLVRFARKRIDRDLNYTWKGGISDYPVLGPPRRMMNPFLPAAVFCEFCCLTTPYYKFCSHKRSSSHLEIKAYILRHRLF